MNPANTIWTEIFIFFSFGGGGGGIISCIEYTVCVFFYEPRFNTKSLKIKKRQIIKLLSVAAQQ